jgi:hypothetical protein
VVSVSIVLEFKNLTEMAQALGSLAVSNPGCVKEACCEPEPVVKEEPPAKKTRGRPKKEEPVVESKPEPVVKEEEEPLYEDADEALFELTESAIKEALIRAKDKSGLDKVRAMFTELGITKFTADLPKETWQKVYDGAVALA